MQEDVLEEKFSHLTHLLDKHALAFPEKVAIYTENQTITYRELHQLVERVSSHMQKLGLESQCLSLMLPNSIELVVCYLACFKIGGIPTLINYHHQSDNISKIITTTHAKCLVIHEEKLAEIKDLNLDQLGIEKVFVVGSSQVDSPFLSFDSLSEGSPCLKSDGIDRNRDAIIFHTSGSTGTPKGVVHTHQSVHEMLINVNHAVDATEDSLMLIPLPLWHIGGFTHAMSKLLIGASCILLRFNGVSDDLLNALEKYHPNMMIMHVPSFYDLIYHPRFNPAILKGIRECIAGGDKVAVDLQKKFYALTGIYLRECYGMTEANLLTINRDNDFEKCGSVGKPISGVEIKLMKNPSQEAQIGELGEIYCKGKNSFQRYFDNPKETASHKVSGWLKTGDVARQDKNGYFWLAGRAADLIKKANQLISPLDIEEHLYEHPSVKMAAVTAMNDENQGIKAYIVLQQNCSLSGEELKSFIYKRDTTIVPDEIRFVKNLPRGKTGKIDRKLLKANAYNEAS